MQSQNNQIGFNNQSFGDNKISKYEMIKFIAEGAYGDVYKVKDKSNDQIYALKKMKHPRESEGIPSTIIRETSLLRDFQHENIVKIIDVIFQDQFVNIVLEYCENDLKSYIEKMPREQYLSSFLIKKILYQILQGLAACHSNRTMHRDLKTANVLISYNEQVKIADFGLARTFSIPIRPYTHEVVTLWYRAPEILLGSLEYSTPVDIWSVGCILAEIVTKKPLFKGESEIEQIFKIFELMGTPDENVWPGVNQLPDFKKTFPQWDKANLRQYFSIGNLDNQGIDLLERLLAYDPQKRISAVQALQHPYFNEYLQRRQENQLLNLYQR